MNVRRLLRLLLPGFVPELIDRMRPAERVYFGPSWPRDLPEGWDDATTEAVMRRNWPTIADRIAGTEPLSMLPYKADQPDLTAHNMLFTFLYVLPIGVTAYPSSIGEERSGTTAWSRAGIHAGWRISVRAALTVVDRGCVGASVDSLGKRPDGPCG